MTDTRPYLLIVANIPAPYRVAAFAELARAAETSNIRFKVLFMAASEHGRLWETQPETWQFEAQIEPGVHPRYGSSVFHLNPSIWRRVIADPPTWLIVGGSWVAPTSLGLLGMRSFLRRTTMLMWAEANYRKSSSSLLVNRIRRLVYQGVDGLIVPGQIGAETLDRWAITQPKRIFYPNLVDGAAYRDGTDALRGQRVALRNHYDIPLDHRVLFWPARLSENTKGICNFLTAVRPLLSDALTVLIAGDGPDRDRIESWLADHEPTNVRLCGHLDQQEMIRLMALSDAAILPSLRDANPLSVIEALWAGLPLLTSINCGNWPETVIPGTNGWIVDPRDHSNVRQTIQEVLALSNERLSAMGLASRTLAEQNFDVQIKTRALLEQLLTTFPPRRF